MLPVVRPVRKLLRISSREPLPEHRNHTYFNHKPWCHMATDLFGLYSQTLDWAFSCKGYHRVLPSLYSILNMLSSSVFFPLFFSKYSFQLLTFVISILNHPDLLYILSRSIVLATQWIQVHFFFLSVRSYIQL